MKGKVNKQLDYKDIIQIIIMMAICIVPFVITPGYRDVTQLAKILITQLLVSIITIIWTIKESKKIELVKSNMRFHLLLGIYFILLVISTMNAYKIEYALFGNPRWWEGIFALTTYILLALFTSYYFNISSNKINLMIVSATLISFYGILQCFGIYIVALPEVFISKEYVLSTMGNPNFLGSYLVLFIPLSMYSFMKSKKKIYIMAFSIMHLCLLMTKTRSAWLGIIASIIVYIYFANKYKRFKRELFILVIIMLVITILFDISTGGLFVKRFLTIIQDFLSIVERKPEYNRAGSSRVFIWERVVKLIYKKPFLGYGFDNLGLVFDKYFGVDVATTLGKRIWIDKAHNEWLQVAVSSGIPSMIIYILFVLEVIRKSSKNLNKNMDILPIYSAVIGYLVQAFFNISVVSVAYIYWIYLGILMKEQYKSRINQ